MEREGGARVSGIQANRDQNREMAVPTVVGEYGEAPGHVDDVESASEPWGYDGSGELER